MTDLLPDRRTPAEATSRTGRRTPLAVLFGVYLSLLVWLVLWKLDVPVVGLEDRQAIKLIPFVASGSAGASAPPEVVANVVFFLPFGVYVALLAPSWRWWRAGGAAAGTSLALEVAQYLLAVGRSDMTDLVSNTTGALLGFFLVVVLRRVHQVRAVGVLTRICLVGTAIALLASVLFFASPIRYR